jgi:hypothetical protein
MATDMDKVIQIKFATFAFITPFLTPTAGSAMDKLGGGGTAITGAVGNGIGCACLSAFK